MIRLVTDPRRTGEIVDRAADHIAIYGHHQGDLAPDNRAADPTAPCCTVGALNVVTLGTPVGVMAGDPDRAAGVAANTAVKLALVDTLGLVPIEVEEDGSTPDYDADDLLHAWNDARDGETVVRELRRAAALLDRTA